MENQRIEKEKYKQEILNSLLNKKVVLVGTGTESADFYNSYCNLLNIDMITANYFLTDALEK